MKISTFSFSCYQFSLLTGRALKTVIPWCSGRLTAPQNQLWWLKLPNALTSTTTASDCQK